MMYFTARCDILTGKEADFSIMLFRSDFMRFLEQYPMKVLKKKEVIGATPLVKALRVVWQASQPAGQGHQEFTAQG